MDDVSPSALAAAPAATPASATTMVLEGRRVDVTTWKTVHPGSEAAITSHVADSDATAVFTHLGHSDEAWATVNALQVGFVSLPDA